MIRRRFLGRLNGSVLAASLLLVSLACAPAPAAPAGHPGPPAQREAAATPAEGANMSAALAPQADWQVNWDSLVAAAKKEGALVISGPPVPTGEASSSRSRRNIQRSRLSSPASGCGTFTQRQSRNGRLANTSGTCVWGGPIHKSSRPEMRECSTQSGRCSCCPR